MSDKILAVYIRLKAVRRLLNQESEWVSEWSLVYYITLLYWGTTWVIIPDFLVSEWCLWVLLVTDNRKSRKSTRAEAKSHAHTWGFIQHDAALHIHTQKDTLSSMYDLTAHLLLCACINYVFVQIRVCWELDHDTIRWCNIAVKEFAKSYHR